MKKAVLFEKLPKKEVKCLACSWYCQIPDNHTGICATRINKNGNLYSLVYGKIVGPEIDPVEKKPFYHFLPGSTLLSFGTAGCNFGCLFCQNSWHSQANKGKTEKEIENIVNSFSVGISPQKIVNLAQANKCQGIAYTYNEPAIFAEFAHDTAKLAKKAGLKNVFVSNGFESKETFDYLKDYLDAINIDLKSFSPKFYRDICKAKIEPVKENIKRYFEAGIHTEVTTLIIPGKNDSAKELTEIAKFLFAISPNIPWHLSGFTPEYKMLDTPPANYEKLITAYEIGKKVGLKYVYAFKPEIADPARSSTYCPNCGELSIFRDGYFVQTKNIEKGHCQKCHEKIYGVWN